MRKLSLILALALALGLLPPRAGAVALEVAGKSAVLMEMSTGTVLYEKNAHEKLAPASVTKVMTLLLIMEAVDSGKITWTDTVTASETAAAKGGSQIYLKVGETMTVTDMVKSIAVSSANDAACAMAEHLAGSESAFVALMNEKAKALGMNDTNFVNCTGLDDGPEAENHKTSAWDIALMSRELMLRHPDIRNFTTIWMDTIRNGEFGLSNTNKLIRFYAGATGLKTGFTSSAGYCLSATAEREGMELIAVVMGAETSQIRNGACKQLLDYGFANFAVAAPEMEGEALVPVRLGAAENVKLVSGENPKLLIDKALRSSVTTEITQEAEITAPVAAGQQLGTLTIRAGDQVLATVPLVAETEVPRLTLWQIWAAVMGKIAMGNV